MSKTHEERWDDGKLRLATFGPRPKGCEIYVCSEETFLRHLKEVEAEGFERGVRAAADEMAEVGAAHCMTRILALISPPPAPREAWLPEDFLRGMDVEVWSKASGNPVHFRRTETVKDGLRRYEEVIE